MIADSARIAVVIPLHNGIGFISDCLTSVCAQRLPCRVIVVDDASVDGSAELVQRDFPDVTLLRTLTNLGYASAINMGLRHAKECDYFLLLNQDTVLEPDCVGQLIQAFNDLPRAGIVGCKILYPGGLTLQHAGGWLKRPGAFGEHYGWHEPDVGKYDAPREVEFVTGAAVMLSRSILDSLGGLATDLSRAYYEDTDLCFRARAAGFGVWYWPKARLTHFEGSSIAKHPYLQNLLFHTGRIGFALRHWPPDVLTDFASTEEADCASSDSLDAVLARSRAYLVHVANLPVALRAREAAYGTRPAMHVNDDVWKAVVAHLLAARETALRRAFDLLAIPSHPLPGDASVASDDDASADPTWSRDEFDAAAHGATPSKIEPIVVPAMDAGSPPNNVAALAKTLDQLDSRLTVHEFRFSSRVPVFGGLIARFRQLWHEIAGFWALRDSIQQQNAVNRALAGTLRSLAEQLAKLEQHMATGMPEVRRATILVADGANRQATQLSAALAAQAARQQSQADRLDHHREHTTRLVRALTEQQQARVAEVLALTAAQQARYDVLLREIARHENDLIEQIISRGIGA